ncbi:MAG: sodium/proton-translocating pyrophosphatase, partial [Endomicrobium sp.]|nr:sodium/proton-translocating pyrophosphatase [Endomicrobium sp.]
GTELHKATVVGDTVGDPFKDTSSVAMNPIIKFTTLFGLLALELALSLTSKGQLNNILTAAFFVVAVIFVVKSFTDMKAK